MSKFIGEEPNYISDGIEDQDGRRYLRFGIGERHVWLPIGDLSVLDRKTIEQLDHVGVKALTNKAKEKLKSDAQSWTLYRQASIAKYPGWIADTYVLPDGRSFSPPRVATPIIDFDLDMRFAPSARLEDWQAAVGPIVQDQPLLLFALAFSLSGPLLRFAPSDVQNLIAEFVGGPNVGKSTIAKLMMSVWGGDPGSLNGACSSWDYTPAELDLIRAQRRDCLLVLDEAAKAGVDEQQRAKKIGSDIFKLADTSSTRRFGQVPLPSIRQVILSTSNIPMSDLIGKATKTHEAVVSRVLTIACDRAFGILEIVPPGFATAEDEVKALDRAASAHYGSAGAALVEQLVRYKQEALVAAIDEGMKRAEAFGIGGGAFGPRATKTLRMVYAVGLIARKFGILPPEWGDLRSAIPSIFPGTHTLDSAPQAKTAFEVMKQHIQERQADVIRAEDCRLPMTSDAFAAMPGIWFEDNRQLVVSTNFFQSNFECWEQLLRELRDQNRLSHDSGNFSKKAPRKITNKGRAYFINLAE